MNRNVYKNGMNDRANEGMDGWMDEWEGKEGRRRGKRGVADDPLCC